MVQVTGGASVTLVGTNFGAYDTGLWYGLRMHAHVWPHILLRYCRLVSAWFTPVFLHPYRCPIGMHVAKLISKIGMRGSDQKLVQASCGSLAHLLHVVRFCQEQFLIRCVG